MGDKDLENVYVHELFLPISPKDKTVHLQFYAEAQWCAPQWSSRGPIWIPAKENVAKLEFRGSTESIPSVVKSQVSLLSRFDAQQKIQNAVQSFRPAFGCGT